VAFNVQPRKTGQVLVGSSRQFGAEDKDIDYGIVRRMMERAQLYMPRLAETSVIRVWTGFRAATPDKLPLIGPWPEDQSVYLATGHEGLGITTCLGTAKLLVAQLRGEPPAISIAPYLPSRVGRLEHARA
jgi:glycine/D-amino acid oxidase-like deaminating enzyme